MGLRSNVSKMNCEIHEDFMKLQVHDKEDEAPEVQDTQKTARPSLSAKRRLPASNRVSSAMPHNVTPPQPEVNSGLIENGLPCDKKEAAPEGQNRRFSLRPRKRQSCTEENMCTDESSEDEDATIIGRKKRKTVEGKTVSHPCLETIFEEPLQKKNGSMVLIGARKLKRSITFAEFISKAARKKKWRDRAKIHGLRLASAKVKRDLCVTLNDLKEKLKKIDEGDS